MRTLTFALMAAVGAGLLATPALACGGPAGSAIAVSYSGSSYTVTNMSHVTVAVTFNGWGTNYSLTLAPGQSGVPSSGGLWNLPMRGYENCSAFVVRTR